MYVIYTDRGASKKLVRNGQRGYFDMYLWCDGKKAYFDAGAIKQSMINYSLFYPELITELRKPATKRNKFSFGKLKLGLSGMLALMFKDVKQKVLADLLSERLIHMVSEPLILTLVLPDDIYNELPEAKDLLVSSFKAAGFQIKEVIPEYLAAVWAYNLHVNRSRQTIRVLHVDIGDRTKIKFIEINEEGNIKLVANQYADIGIRQIESMLRDHIENEFKRHNYSGHNKFPESLDLDERFDYEIKLSQLTNSLMVSTEESIRFYYNTKHNESVEIEIDMNPRDTFIDLCDMKFVFPTRIMQYQSSLHAVLVNFLKNNGLDHSIDKIIFSGAGCRFQTIVDGLRKTLDSEGGKTQNLRMGMEYDSVLALGGSAYNDATDYDNEYRPILSDEERKLFDQINTIITEPWIIPTSPAVVMEPDVRYDLASDANHIRFDFSDKERISTKIELIIEGVKQYFDLQSGKQHGVECLDVNQYHICLSELKSSEVYFIAEADTEFSNLDFFLDISDLLKDSSHHTLDSHHVPISLLKTNKIRLLKLYQHASKWRITACLEPLDVPIIRQPQKLEPVPTPQKSARAPEKSPSPQPIVSEAGVGTHIMLEGERVPLQDSKYQVEISNTGFTLFTIIYTSDDKGLILTSNNQALDMALFNSEKSLTLNLNLLEKHRYKRALICLAASGTAGKGGSFSCFAYSLGVEIQNLGFEGTTNSLYSKVLEFYQKDGKWRLLGEVESLPDNTMSSGVIENSELADSGTKPDNLVSGEKFNLSKEVKMLRVDFTGPITTNLNLVVNSLDAAGKRVPIWKLEKNAQIINQSDKQKVISLVFDLSRLMFDQYVCMSDNYINFLDSLTFLDADTHKPIKSALRQRGSCLSNCSYLFKLYKYKGVWKIGYLCD